MKTVQEILEEIDRRIDIETEYVLNMDEYDRANKNKTETVDALDILQGLKDFIVGIEG